MSAIRNFMISKQFMEVETPMMHYLDRKMKGIVRLSQLEPLG